jgi:hypothetical protein
MAYVELALVGRHEVERDDTFVGLLVGERNVSVAERAAAHVLTAQAHVVLYGRVPTTQELANE